MDEGARAADYQSGNERRNGRHYIVLFRRGNDQSDGGICSKKAIDTAAARLERAFNGSLCVDSDGLPIVQHPSAFIGS